MPLVAVEIGTNVMRCVARGALRFASLEELLTEPAVTEALQPRRAIALSGLFIDPYGLTCNTEIAQGIEYLHAPGRVYRAYRIAALAHLLHLHLEPRHRPRPTCMGA